MAYEKLYTAKQATVAVLEKVGELLKKSEALKATLTKSEPSMKEWKCEKCESIYKSENKHEKCEDHKMAKSELELTADFESLKGLLKAEVPWKKPEKDADQHADGKAPKGEIHPKESEQAPKDGPREQKDPMHNAKEQAEGNNELAGTTPTQVGQDGKNKPGGDEIKGHLKLAKFVGRMDYKRQAKQNQAKVSSQEHVGNAQAASSAQHNASLKGN